MHGEERSTPSRSWAGARAAASAQLRFFETYARDIRGVPRTRVDGLSAGIDEATLDAEAIMSLARSVESLILEETQRPVPKDGLAQVREGHRGRFCILGRPDRPSSTGAPRTSLTRPVQRPSCT